MPVSATQHRATTGVHWEKPLLDVKEKAASAAVPGRKVLPQEILQFSTNLTNIRNTKDRRATGNDARPQAKSTSPHVSKDLKKAVAPDKRGLRWDANDHAYLKIKNAYINVRKLNGNRYRIISDQPEREMYLRYRDQEFKLENTGERLKNILTTGLGGRKRPHDGDEGPKKVN